MICSYCYKSQIAVKHDVGHWWNNPEDSVYVCSDECYAKLEILVKEGTWMHHKPEAIFGKKEHTPSPNFEKKKTIEAITDKQFTDL
jgi:hypothetical protein